MTLQWVSDDYVPKQGGTLGAFPISASDALEAKKILASWAKTPEGLSCLSSYGSDPADTVGTTWGDRDGTILACFAKWWNDQGKTPALNAGSYSVSTGKNWVSADSDHLAALTAWSASVSPKVTDPQKMFHARAVLAMWNRTQSFIMAGYPTADDMTQDHWTYRDARMLGSFTIWWNNAANPPLMTWKLTPLPAPTFFHGVQESDLTEVHVFALDMWRDHTAQPAPSCIESCLGSPSGTPAEQLAKLTACIDFCAGTGPAPGGGGQPSGGTPHAPCPAGLVWDEATQGCVQITFPAPPPLPGTPTCTNGQVWNAAKNQCECPPGQLINSATGKCAVPPPTCAAGWSWDPVGKKCIPPGATPAKAAATKGNAGTVLAVLLGVGIVGAIVNAMIKVPARGMQENSRHRKNPGPTRRTGAAPIANPCDHNWTRELYYFSLGAYGSTHVYVWANSADDAMEEMVEWADDNAPGLLSTIGEADLREAAEDLGIEYDPEDIDYRIVERAEADMYVVGHTTLKHGNAMPMWEIHFDEVHGKKRDAVKRLSEIECEDEGPLPLPQG